MTPKREEKADHLVTSEPKQQHGGEFPVFLRGYVPGLEKMSTKEANGTRQKMSQQTSALSGQRTRNNLA